MVGSIGQQLRKLHKNKARRHEGKQMVQRSKGHYRIKSRVVKENSEVRNKKEIQSRILGRQREMARLKNTQRKRSPLGK
jgi:hypothetical protein